MPPTAVASRALPASGGPTRLMPSSLDTPAVRQMPASSTTVAMQGNAVATHKELKVIDDASLEQCTLLILKGGGGYLARDYWVEPDVFHVVTPNGDHKMFPVSRLDLQETVRLNRERNVDFVLRTPESRSLAQLPPRD